MRWLVRPKPYEDESQSGYLFRLAEENGFYSYSGWQSANAKEADSALLCHEDVASWEAAPETNFDKRFSLVRFQRICPLCIRATPYIRAAWDHAMLPNCLIHQVELICSCPKCKTILRRGPSRIRSCVCGHLLAHSDHKKVIPSQLEHVLAWKLGFTSTLTADNSLTYFSQLSASDLIKLIMLVGTYEPAGTRKKPRKVSLKAGSDNARSIILQASDVFSDWPVRFHQLLSLAYNRHPQNATLHRVFGSFYTSLYKDLHGEQFQFVRQAFDNWTSREWKGHLTERHSRLAKSTRAHKKVIPVTTLSKNVGVSASHLEELVASGQLRGSTRVFPSGRRTTMVEINQERMVSHLTNTHNLERASIMLGIPETRLRALIDAGLISGVCPSQGEKWKIHIGEIDRVLAAVKGLKLFEGNNRAGYWTVNYILRFRLADGDSFLELFKAILKGDVESYRLPKVGKRAMAAVLVSKESFQDWQLGKVAGVSIPQVAERLKIKQEVAYHLVRNELLKTINRGRLGDFVSEQAIAEFNALHVWARDIALSAKTSPRKVISDLSLAGVGAVAGPDIDGCRQYLFLRNDVAVSGLFGQLNSSNVTKPTKRSSV